MFHRILLCANGSDGGDNSAVLAAAMASHFCAEVVMVIVFEDLALSHTSLDLGGLALEGDIDRERASLFREAAERDTIPVLQGSGARYSVLLEFGEPVERILKTANDKHVDLIVLGGHRHPGLDDLILGNVSQGVLDHAPCPVLIAKELRKTRGQDPFQHILLATDGADAANSAADVAVDVAQKFATSLTVLHVAEDRSRHAPRAIRRAGFGLDSNLLTSANRVNVLEQDVRRRAARAGVYCSFHEEAGRPEQVIVDFARERNADLIVIGCRALSGLKHIVLGSVSNHVVRHAECPVLVAR